MATQTPRELVDYYASLLILQYVGRPRAYATIQTQAAPVIQPQTTVQTISFSPAPTAGSFALSYLGVVTSVIWSASAGTIQTQLRGIAGLEDVLVTGSIAAGLTVTYVNVLPPAELITVTSNTLTGAGSVAVEITLAEIDETLPTAVMNGFNLLGPNIAVGVQLDTIGKYVGVTRTGAGFYSQITLDDADYLSLIQMAIIKNYAGSSLATIQDLLHQFFPDQILVFDYQNMQMSYLVSTTVGSQDLIQLFITEGLLPRPMAVQVALVIYAPVITTFFGFRTYQLPAFNASPFNSYSDYQTDWPWLSYGNAVNL